MKYLSVCSGIEAASVAWHPLGWEPVGFSEIEPFPSAVLGHHYPNVQNFGDMTKFKEWPLDAGAIDLLVGGTPCQSFSVAGLRQGLKDPRGNLMLTYLAIAARLRPRWVVWENVPGVLSSNGGRDFGSFLGGLAELGYGFAYRVLDAQWCRTHGHPRAVPQRRRRVFVVGCLGDATVAAKVLFERESVQRHSAKSGAAREEIASDVEGRARAGCWWDGESTSHTLTKCEANRAQRMPDKDNFGAVLQPITVRSSSMAGFVEDTVGETMRASGGDCHGGSESLVLQPVPYTKAKRAQPDTDDETSVEGKVNPTLSLFDCGDVRATTIAIQGNLIGRDKGGPQGLGASTEGAMYTMTKADVHGVAQVMTVRRLLPVECERLQGFPDDYTLIPWRKKAAGDCPDGPRYKALGNSMAVNCMAWIGERIAAVEAGEDK